MKRFKMLLAVCFVGNVTAAFAQPSPTPTASPSKIETMDSHTFTLSNIRSIKAVNMRLDGKPLPGPRYHFRGSYAPSCPIGTPCMMKFTPPKPGLLLLRQWDYAEGSVQAKIMNICRRTIENAGPEAAINLTGKVIIDRPGSDTVVYLQSITSCEVEYPKRLS